MPDVEAWTFNSVRSSADRIRRLGINFGAPGDRRTDDGTLWLDFPSVGGPSPDVPLSIHGDALTYFREHSLRVGSQQMPWVFASGVRGTRRITIQCADSAKSDASPLPYSVRLYWRSADGPELQRMVTSSVQVTGSQQPCTCEEVATTATNTACVVQHWRNIPVKNQLEIEVGPIAGTDPTSLQERPLLCGIEIVAE
jgi:hypothetical protein